MDYFQITQDHRLIRTPTIYNFNKILRRKNLFMERAHLVKDRTVVFSNASYKEYYADVLDTQMFLISELIKRVFELYEGAMAYKYFCIINNQVDTYFNYFAPIFLEVDCLVKNQENNRNERKGLILYEEKVKGYSIFKAKYAEKDLIMIRSDVAESLLRRNIKGVKLEKVTTL